MIRFSYDLFTMHWYDDIIYATGCQSWHQPWLRKVEIYRMDENLQKKFKLPKLRYFGLGLAVILLAVVLSGSFYTINEQEQAVLTTFG